MRPRLAACATVHCPPSLATSLPSFTPSPYSCENKIHKQDMQTECARAPPPHLCRRRGKVRPPPFAPLQPPSRTGCTNGKRRGPASSFVQGAWNSTPSPFCPSFSPTRDDRTREPTRSPTPFTRCPRLRAKGAHNGSPFCPQPPTCTRTRCANEHAGTPPFVLGARRGTSPLPPHPCPFSTHHLLRHGRDVHPTWVKSSIETLSNTKRGSWGSEVQGQSPKRTLTVTDEKWLTA